MLRHWLSCSFVLINNAGRHRSSMHIFHLVIQTSNQIKEYIVKTNRNRFATFVHCTFVLSNLHDKSTSIPVSFYRGTCILVYNSFPYITSMGIIHFLKCFKYLYNWCICSGSVWLHVKIYGQNPNTWDIFKIFSLFPI